MKITSHDIDCLEKGSVFLGTGGGTEYPYSKRLAQYHLRKNHVQAISVEALDDEDLVILIGTFGCPLIEAEKNYNISSLKNLLQQIELSYQKPIKAIAPIGVGGSYLFIPLFLASVFDIPIVDGDILGRCFSEMQMVSTHVNNISPQESFICNLKDHVFKVISDNFFDLEKYIRHITLCSGGSCLGAPQILKGEEAKRGMIPGTLSQALNIGKIIEEAQDFDTLMAYTKGKMIGIGGIVSIEALPLSHAFRKRIVIKNLYEHKNWEIFMHNEYELLLVSGQCVAEVPDIITLCDPETCIPYKFSQLHYGVNVAICTMKAPSIWYTDKGLALTRTKKYLEGKEQLCA